ncbi:MAG TPA: DUF6508 domain-containing protein [Bacteroidales bacterium]|nr:DUF6508 domain-containing protein [Bacteroidales bacterium]
MIIPEAQHVEIINAIPREDWQPLFELIPEIERSEEFGEMLGGNDNEKGEMMWPFWVEEEVITRFRDIIYNLPVTVAFNYMEWDEGKEMASKQDFDFDTIDVPTKCKIITAIMRNDRFCDGALISAFESGLMLALLKSIQRQVMA